MTTATRTARRTARRTPTAAARMEPLTARTVDGLPIVSLNDYHMYGEISHMWQDTGLGTQEVKQGYLWLLRHGRLAGRTVQEQCVLVAQAAAAYQHEVLAEMEEHLAAGTFADFLPE